MTAEALVKQMGWDYRPSGIDQIAVQICPFCGNQNGKFYICVDGPKDGLWCCKVCSEQGNIWQLQQKVGITSTDIVSLQDAARGIQQPDPIPNVDMNHWKLMNDENFGDVLDYLVADRGFSIDVLTRFKIGVDQGKDGTKWIVYPYLNADGTAVFVKYRTAPPAKKDFRGLRGRDNPLFNAAVLVPGLDEVFLAEGEADCLSLVTQGVVNSVGIPGASIKKADWIKRLDDIAPKAIYLLYDNDKVGQQNAKDMAIRIGIEKVLNILLPPFSKADGTPGKDINEWFRVGHTPEDFAELKAQARPFAVDGIQSAGEVLQELYDEFTTKGTAPTLDTPWPSVNGKAGGFEWGDLVGVLADAKIGKSTLALNWGDYYARNGTTSLFYCNEMKPTRVVRKWVSYVTQTDDTPGNSKMTPETVQEALAMIPDYKGDLLFGYTKNDPKQVFSTIRQAVRRYGVKVVVFDNLHLLGRSLDNMAQEMSVLTKDFKSLAMELNILIILIMQPKRIADGKIVGAHDAYGSSAIPKDVDSMLCLHRNRVGVLKEAEFNGIMETEENFDPMMLVRADLTRYSAGGSCTLYMDGATSTVRELGACDQVKAITETGGIPIEA